MRVGKSTRKIVASHNNKMIAYIFGGIDGLRENAMDQNDSLNSQPMKIRTFVDHIRTIRCAVANFIKGNTQSRAAVKLSDIAGSWTVGRNICRCIIRLECLPHDSLISFAVRIHS